MTRPIFPLALTLRRRLPTGAGRDDAEVLSELQNPGYHAKPDWFKNSFLDIREDVAEAAAAASA
jgi:hypothetical protein